MYDNGKLAILDKTIDMDSDSFKVALFTSGYTPNLATDDLYSGLSNEVSSTNTGYTTAGIALTMTALSVASNTVKWTTGTSIAWTAGSANLTARTAVIYHVATGKLICNCLLDTAAGGTDVTATNGNTLTIAVSTNGILTFGGAIS